MAPTRVGIIGLSPAQEFSGGGTWAAATHLPALQSLKEDYEIVALANSTIESAKRSAAAHGLPSSVKTYGSAEDIAKDPDIDLVVVSVRVDKHHALAKPALLHGKKVLVEWPLARTAIEIEELTQLAADNGVDTAVTLQARAMPTIQKLKEIIFGGQIGRVLSSTVVMTSTRTTETWDASVRYYLDVSSGGNEFIIAFGHCKLARPKCPRRKRLTLTGTVLDTFIQVIGDIPHPQAILETKYPLSKLVDADGTIVDPAFPKTSPDHILVQGIAGDGVVSSFVFRKSREPVDGTGIRWIITGTNGEVCITGPDGWQMLDKELQVELKVVGEAAQIIDVNSHRAPAVETLPSVAANVASMYAAFAKRNESEYATFESAARTHGLLDRIKAATVLH